MSTSKGKRSIGKHACERCRKSKTRCLLDTFDAHGKCRKCFSSNLECTWKEISTKRRRIRTDARVSELERQLKNFETALTHLGHNTPGEINDDRSSPSTELAPHSGLGASTFETVTTDGFEPRMVGSVRAVCNSLPEESSSIDLSRSSTTHQKVAHNDSFTAILDEENVSSARQAELVQDFNHLLLPRYPIIAVMPQEEFGLLSRSKPLLTAAVVTAASSVSEPTLFKKLHTKMTRILSEQVLVQGEKSIELVQSILICAVWYHPPPKIENLTFQLCNMAGTMSLELGLGGRSSWHANHRVVAGFKADVSNATTEAFRTMFSVYLTCSRIAISLRRQRMISFSPGTEMALETFAEHAESTNDKRLVAWVRLQLVAEDIEKMKTNIESRTGSIFNDREAVKNDLALFSDRLHDWEAATSEPTLNETLRIDFCFCKGKLHELAIYADYNIEDLSFPFLTPAKPVVDRAIGTDDLNPTYIRALLSFINDCHAILDAILTTDVAILRCCPLLTHLRVPYAFKALAMVRKALESPNKSNVSKVVDDETLKFKRYVVALSKHIEAASSQGLYPAPSAALKIRDLVMNMRPSTGRRCGESDVQSRDLRHTQNDQWSDHRPLRTNECTDMPTEVNSQRSNYDPMLQQFHDPLLLSLDDLDLLNFDFGPEFMDWPAQ